MMPSNRYLLHALKYSAMTMGVLIAIAGISALVDNASEESLQGRLVSPQQRGITPTVNFTSADIANGGVSLPPDTHVIFGVPRGQRILLMTFFGGSDKTKSVLFWGYCYSGNEQRNKEQGKTGRALYDGRFFFSDAELASRNPPQAAETDLISLHRGATTPETARERGSEIVAFDGGESCYVMIDGETAGKTGGIYASLDTDGDGIPDLRERHMSLNPSAADTDGDGIDDAREVFVSKTDPTIVDTDRDGLADVCEDKNADGQLDPGETSPKNSDTDRDDLCDGPGFASGCPEEREEFCDDEDHCRIQITSPAYGEDMNSNCKVDQGETDPRKDSTFPPKTDFQYKFDKGK